MCSKAKELKCTSKIVFLYIVSSQNKVFKIIHTIELQRYKWAYKFTTPQIFKSKFYSKILVGAQ